MLSNTILEDLDIPIGLDETENEQSPTRQQEVSVSETSNGRPEFIPTENTKNPNDSFTQLKQFDLKQSESIHSPLNSKANEDVKDEVRVCCESYKVKLNSQEKKYDTT